MPMSLCAIKRSLLSPPSEPCKALSRGAKITRVAAILLATAAVVVAIAALVFSASPTLIGGAAQYLIKPAIVTACTLKVLSVYFYFLNYLFSKRADMSQKIVETVSKRDKMQDELNQLKETSKGPVPTNDEINTLKTQKEQKLEKLNELNQKLEGEPDESKLDETLEKSHLLHASWSLKPLNMEKTQ